MMCFNPKFLWGPNLSFSALDHGLSNLCHHLKGLCLSFQKSTTCLTLDHGIKVIATEKSLELLINWGGCIVDNSHNFIVLLIQCQ